MFFTGRAWEEYAGNPQKNQAASQRVTAFHMGSSLPLRFNASLNGAVKSLPAAREQLKHYFLGRTVPAHSTGWNPLLYDRIAAAAWQSLLSGLGGHIVFGGRWIEAHQVWKHGRDFKRHLVAR